MTLTQTLEYGPGKCHFFWAVFLLTRVSISMWLWPPTGTTKPKASDCSRATTTPSSPRYGCSVAIWSTFPETQGMATPDRCSKGRDVTHPR